ALPWPPLPSRYWLAKNSPTAADVLTIAHASAEKSSASQRLQPGIGEHQPFVAGALEIYLHARMCPGAFVARDHALAEGVVAHARAQTHSRRRGAARQPLGLCRDRARARDVRLGAQLLDQGRIDLAQEARGAGVVLAPVQPA